MDYYPTRNVKREQVRFNDEILFQYVQKFQQHVWQYAAVPVKPSENRLIIIDRKHNR